jgi:hypothetical protein
MKDPAALFYIDTWLSATAEMDADVRGWYLNLILHNYDKKNLPNNIEKLAVLAGVKYSEFERFKQVFEQVLKQKFELNENNRLENIYAKIIIAKRENFKEKREKSGSIGQVIKTAKSIEQCNGDFIEHLKDTLKDLSIEDIKKHMDKHLLKHLLKLYINGDGNGNKDTDDKENPKPKNPKSKLFVPPTLFELVEYFKENGFPESLAERAFKYYDVAEWKDSKGNQVKNWKQKMQSVWFKDENKSTTLPKEPNYKIL